MFFRGSRYEPVPTAQLVREDGVEIAYKRIRFVRRDPAQMGHVVQDGERLDQIAWTVFRDPEMWWRIADANADLDPDALTERAGRVLGIALPLR
ncbi:MAG: hypothetical protein WAS21_03590 [Geminicoccaceae bacterium]